MAEIKETQKKYDITVRVRVRKKYQEDRYGKAPMDETEETAAITILADSSEAALEKLSTIIPAL